MKRRFSLAVATILCLGTTPGLGLGTAYGQSNLDPAQQKVWDELAEQMELNDKRGMEKVIRTNGVVFKSIFDQFDYDLAHSDEVDVWKKARMLAELLDANAGGNLNMKRLDVIQALSLEDRQKRRDTWTEWSTVSSALAAAAKNRELEKVQELTQNLVTIADTFHQLNDQLLRGYALVDVANVLRDADQKLEALNFYKQADEGLASQGYEKLVLHSEVKKQIELLSNAGKGGDASSESATSWAKDANGQPLPWSDPVPLRYSVEEKLPWSAINTPGYTNSEDTMQWNAWGLEGNGPATFNDQFKPLGREIKVKRDGFKILIDEDGDGKFREVKANHKPSLVEVEKEFEDPWTKEKVKQKYAFLLGTGGEDEAFFGFDVNAAPSATYYALRYAPACSLKGTVLGVDLRIFDDNVNGVFGDAFAVNFNGYSKGVQFPVLDAMQLGSAKNAQPFSEFIEVGGEFYRLKMSTSDEAYSVKTRKLDVQTGTVVLDFKNKVKPQALILSALDKFKGAHFNIAVGKPVRVPCDRYEVSYGILREGKKDNMQSCIIVKSAEMAAIEVKPDTETKVELGAPYHFVYETEELNSGDVKIPGKSVAVKGRGGELYLRFWDTPPIPEAVQLFRDGKSAGKAVPMQRPTFEDFKKDGTGRLMFPLDLTLSGNGASGRVGVSMKLKKPALLDGPIETKHDAAHE